MKLHEYLKLPIITIYIIFLLLMMPVAQFTPVYASSNTAPSISGIPDQTFEENLGSTITILDSTTQYASDAETSIWLLQYSVTSSNTNSVSNCVLMQSGNDKPIYCDIGEAGISTLTVTVSDGEFTDTDSFVVIVTSNNNVPTAADRHITITKNVAEDISLVCSDADAETLTYFKDSNPNNGVLSSTTDGDDTFNYDPNTDYVGTDSFTYYCKDPQNAQSNTATVYLTVEDTTPPAATCQESCQDLVSRDGACVSVPLGLPSNYVHNSEGDTGCIDTTGNDAALCYCDGPVVSITRSEDNTYYSGETGNLVYSGLITGWTIKKVADYITTGNSETIYYSVDQTETDTVPYIDLDVSGSSCTDGFWGTNVGCDPSQDVNASLSYNYYLCSNVLGCANNNVKDETLYINFRSTNVAPVANDDYVSTPEDTDLIIYPLTNDVDDDGDALTYNSHTQPSHGSISWGTSSGELFFHYYPDANYNGADSFTYTITDGNGAYDTATVHITVTPVNDAPIAYNDNVQVQEDSVNNAIFLTATDADLDFLTYAILNNVDHGTLTHVSGAQYSYTPNPDFSGIDSLAFVANDGTIDSNAATVQIEVLAVNDAPVAYDVNGTTDEDTQTILTLDYFDADGHAATSCELTAINNGFVSQPCSCTAAVCTAGITPSSNSVADVTTTYRVRDSTNDYSNYADILVTVNSENDAPIANDDNYTFLEDSGLHTLNVLSNDTDPDLGDTFTLVSINTVGTSGTASINGNNVDYTPAANFVGTTTFTYVINDTVGATSTAIVTITLTQNPDAPVLTGLPDVNMTEDDPATTIISNLGTYVTDPDTGDTFTYTIFSESNISIVDCEIVTLDDVRCTPQTNMFGFSDVTIRVTDSYGLTNEDTFRVTVTEENDAPVLAPIGNQVTNESQLLTFTLSATDVENDIPFVYTANNLPSGANLNSTTGVFTWIPAYNQEGYYPNITFTVTDNRGASDSETIAITVNNVDRAPIAYPINVSTLEETSLNITFDCVDPDGDAIIAYEYFQPSNGNATAVVANTIQYTPGPEFSGLDYINYSCSNALYSNHALITIEVNATNDAPIANDVYVETIEDNAVTIDFDCTDVDTILSSLTYYNLTSPSTGTLSTIFGSQVNYTPALNDFGVYTFDYYCNDGIEDSNTATVTINVTADNDAPVANDDYYTTLEDISLEMNLLLNDTDVDGDNLTITSYTALSPLNSGNLTFFSDNPHFEPAQDFFGNVTFNYTITDGKGGYDTALVFIQVISQNDLPVVNIVEPINGTTFNISDSIFFNGTANDVEDGVLSGASLIWTSNVDGFLSNGNSFSSSSLSSGNHTITLTATDSDNQSSSDSIIITIVDNVLPTIEILNPQHGFVYNVTMLDVVINATDDELDYVNFYFNYLNGSSAQASQNYIPGVSQFNVPTDNETYEMYAIAHDVSGNIASAGPILFYVNSNYEDNNTPYNESPLITINAPEKFMLYNNLTQAINIVYDHPFPLTMNYSFTPLGMAQENSFNYYGYENYSTTYTHNLDQQLYTISAYGIDEFNNNNSEANTYFINASLTNNTNDTVAPVVTILNPQNHYVYNDSLLPIVIDIQDLFPTTTYYTVELLDGTPIQNATPYINGVSTITNNFNNSTYVVYAYSTDLAGNVGNDTVMYYYNSNSDKNDTYYNQSPVLTLISPNNGWQYNYTNLPITINVNHPFPFTLDYEIDEWTGGVNPFVFGDTTNANVATNYSGHINDTTYMITANVFDDANVSLTDGDLHYYYINLSTSNSTNYTGLPSLTIIEPQDNYIYNYTNLSVIVNADHVFPTTVTYDINYLNTTDYAQGQGTNGINTYVNHVDNNSYSIVANAYDDYSNNALSVTHNYVVNRSANNGTVNQTPILIVTSPLNNFVYNTTDLELNASISHILPVTTDYVVELLNPNTFTYNSTVYSAYDVSGFVYNVPITNHTDLSTYRLTAYTEDAAGNNDSVVLYYYINLSSNSTHNNTDLPSIEITMPQDGFEYNTTELPVVIDVNSIFPTTTNYQIFEWPSDNNVTSLITYDNNNIQTHSHVNDTTYYVYAEAVDLVGGLSNDDTNFYYINLSSPNNDTNYTTAPTVNIITPEDAYLYNYTLLDVNITVDHVFPTNVTYDVDGLATGNEASNVGYPIINYHNHENNDTYTLTAYAFDNYNNIGNATNTYVINTSSNYTGPVNDTPLITINSPLSSYNYNYTNITIDVDISHSLPVVSNYKIELLNSTTFLPMQEVYLGTSNSFNIVDWSDNHTTNNTYLFTIYVEDGAGNNATETAMYYVDTSSNYTGPYNESPVLTLVNPKDGWVYNYTNLAVNITITIDYPFPTNTYYEINELNSNDFTIVGTPFSNYNLSNRIINVQHNHTTNTTYYIYAYTESDSNNSLNDDGEATYFVDITSNKTGNYTQEPLVDIISPQDSHMYNYTLLPIVIDVTHPFPVTTYYNITYASNNLERYANSGSNDVLDSHNHLDNNSYAIIAYAIDNYLNTNIATPAVNNYVVNTSGYNGSLNQDPVITIINPMNNYVYNTTNLELNVTISHVLPVTTDYVIELLNSTTFNPVAIVYSSYDQTGFVYNVPIINHTDLSTYRLTAYTEDAAGNNDSVVLYYYINLSSNSTHNNTDLPSIEITMPQDGFEYNTTELPVVIDVNSIFPTTTNYQIFEWPSDNNVTSLITYDNNNIQTHSHVNDTTYYVYAEATDTVGGLSDDDTNYYYINLSSPNNDTNYTTIPTINIISPEDSLVYNNQSVLVDMNSSHVFPTTIYYNITTYDLSTELVSTQIFAGSYPQAHLDNETYVITAYAIDNVNSLRSIDDVNTYFINTSNNNNTNFTQSPVLTIVSPENHFVYNVTNLPVIINAAHLIDVNITYTIYDELANPIANGTDINAVSEFAEHTFNGTYTLVAYASDEYNNNDTAQVTYYINTSSNDNNTYYNESPVLTIVEPQNLDVFNTTTVDWLITINHPFDVSTTYNLETIDPVTLLRTPVDSWLSSNKIISTSYNNHTNATAYILSATTRDLVNNSLQDSDEVLYAILINSSFNGTKYNISPSLEIINPADQAGYNYTNLSVLMAYSHLFPVKIYYNITDNNTGITSANFEYDQINLANNYYDHSSNSTYIISAYAIDNSSNMNFTSNMYFIDTNSSYNGTNYTIAPNIIINSPTNGTIYNTTNITIDVDASSHPFPITLTYTINDWTNGINNVDSGLGMDTIQTYFDLHNNATTYNITVYGIDAYGNNATVTNWYYINTSNNNNTNTTQQPQVTIVEPINGFNYNYSLVDVNITVQHIFPTTITYDVVLSNNTNEATSLDYPINSDYQHLTNDTYMLIAYADDGFGNVGTNNVSYVINTTSNHTGPVNQTPIVTINSPQDSWIYNYTLIPLNVSVNHSLPTTITYNVTYLSNGLQYQAGTYTEGTLLNINHTTNETYIISVYAEDVNNNIGNATATYFVDVTSNYTGNNTFAPVLTLNSPQNLYIYNTTNITVDYGVVHNFGVLTNYTIEELDPITFAPVDVVASANNIANFTYNKIESNHSDNTTYRLSIVTWDAQGLSDSETALYYINMSGNYSGPNNDTNTTYVPEVTINSPIDGYLYNYSLVDVNITVQHIFPTTITYDVLVNGTPENTNIDYPINNNYQHLTNESYTLIAYATDGNQTGNASSYYVVDTTANNSSNYTQSPAITIVQPGDYFVYNTTTIPLEAQVTHNFSTTILYNVTYADTGLELTSGAYTQGSVLPINGHVDNKTYIVYVTAFDSYGNAATENATYFVDTTSNTNNTNYTINPVITISSPQEHYVYNSSFPIIINITHPFDVTTNYYVEELDEHFNPINTEHNITTNNKIIVDNTLVHSANATYRLTVFSDDGNGLTNQETIMYYFDTTSNDNDTYYNNNPVITLTTPSDGYVYNQSILPLIIDIAHPFPVTTDYFIDLLEPVTFNTLSNDYNKTSVTDLSIVDSHNHSTNNRTYTLRINTEEIVNSSLSASEQIYYYINTGYSSNNTNYTEAPQVTVVDPADMAIYNNTEIPVEVIINHPFMTIATYNITNATGVPVINNTNYTGTPTTVTHTQDGQYYFELIVTDNYVATNDTLVTTTYALDQNSSNNGTIDTEAPTISIISPSNYTTYNYTNINVIVDANDPFLTEVTYNITLAGVEQDSNISNNDISTTFDHPGNGTYVITATATDLSNHTSQSVHTYYVNTTSNYTGPSTEIPVIVINNPSDGYVYNQTNLLINISYFHPYDLDVTYTITEQGVGIENTTSYFAQQNYAAYYNHLNNNATYIINVYGEDAVGNNNNSISTYVIEVPFNKNNTPYNVSPTVNILQPGNGFIFNTSSFPVQAVVTHPFDTTMNYFVRNSSGNVVITNTTYLEGTTVFDNVPSEGTYDIVMYTQDNYSNEGFATNTFYVSYDYPFNNVTYNGSNNIYDSDVNGVYYDNTTVDYFVDTNLNYISDSFVNGSNITDINTITNSEIINSNISGNSTIVDTLVEDSEVDDSIITGVNTNITNGSIITGSEIYSSCTIINTTLINTVINVTGECYLKNEYFDTFTIAGPSIHSQQGDPVNVTMINGSLESYDSDLFNSVLTGTLFMNLSFINHTEIIESSLTNTTVLDSNVENSIANHSTINNSNVTGNSVLIDVNVQQNSTVSGSTVQGGSITNSTSINSELLGGSNLQDSSVTNTNLFNTSLTNVTLLNSNLNNSDITNFEGNNVILQGVTSDDSVIVDSNITNSTVLNSSFSNIFLLEGKINNSLVYFNSTIGDWNPNTNTSKWRVLINNNNNTYDIALFQDNDGDGYVEFDDDAFFKGHSTIVYGSMSWLQDCDDTNANINPGAGDIKGNGIDENCDGVDATYDTSSGGGGAYIKPVTINETENETVEENQTENYIFVESVVEETVNETVKENTSTGVNETDDLISGAVTDTSKTTSWWWLWILLLLILLLLLLFFFYRRKKKGEEQSVFVSKKGSKKTTSSKKKKKIKK